MPKDPGMAVHFKPIESTQDRNYPIYMVGVSEMSGRLGHEGLFRIQTEYLPVRTQKAFEVYTNNDVTGISYRFVTPSDKVLAEGRFLSTELQGMFVLPFVVPKERFYLEITATSSDNTKVNWRSLFPYDISGFVGELDFGAPEINGEESRKTTVKLSSINATGKYKVRLVYATGFSGDAGPWTTTLTPGSSTQFHGRIVAPKATDSNRYQLYSVRLVVTPEHEPNDDYYTYRSITLR